MGNASVHYGANCDNCYAENFEGRRHKSLTRLNFDLCGECYAKPTVNHAEFGTVRTDVCKEGGVCCWLSPVHLCITCDDCGWKNFKGPRYKSFIKPDYDLCGRCYAKPEADEDEFGIVLTIEHEVLWLSPVHRGITCHSCGRESFKGPRYKSFIKPNYDLCGQCYAKPWFDQYEFGIALTMDHKALWVWPAHHGVICNNCNMNDFTGPRYNSLTRPDYNLCGPCYAKPGVHQDEFGIIVTVDHESSWVWPVHRGVMCGNCGDKNFTGPRYSSLTRPGYDLCNQCYAKPGINRGEFRSITRTLTRTPTKTPTGALVEANIAALQKRIGDLEGKRAKAGTGVLLSALSLAHNPTSAVGLFLNFVNFFRSRQKLRRLREIARGEGVDLSKLSLKRKRKITRAVLGKVASWLFSLGFDFDSALDFIHHMHDNLVTSSPHDKLDVFDPVANAIHHLEPCHNDIMTAVQDVDGIVQNAAVHARHLGKVPNWKKIFEHKVSPPKGLLIEYAREHNILEKIFENAIGEDDE